MQADFFESSRLSLIISWAISVPMFFAFIRLVMFAFEKHEGIPWLYSAWVSLCFIALGPLRYDAFLVALATSYPWQNLSALLSVIWVWDWIPALIAFGLLNFIGVLAPLWLTTAIADSKAYRSKVRLVISAIIAPVAAIGGTYIFSLVLPFAALTAHMLDADAIIRATNGPARIVFLANGSGMIALPPYYEKTPQTYTDKIRSHVALLYLRDSDHDNFLKMAYPNLYSEFHETIMKM